MPGVRCAPRYCQRGHSTQGERELCICDRAKTVPPVGASRGFLSALLHLAEKFHQAAHREVLCDASFAIPSARGDVLDAACLNVLLQLYFSWLRFLTVAYFACGDVAYFYWRQAGQRDLLIESR